MTFNTNESTEFSLLSDTDDGSVPAVVKKRSNSILNRISLPFTSSSSSASGRRPSFSSHEQPKMPAGSGYSEQPQRQRSLSASIKKIVHSGTSTPTTTTASHLSTSSSNILSKAYEVPAGTAATLRPEQLSGCIRRMFDLNAAPIPAELMSTIWKEADPLPPLSEVMAHLRGQQETLRWAQTHIQHNMAAALAPPMTPEALLAIVCYTAGSAHREGVSLEDCDVHAQLNGALRAGIPGWPLFARHLSKALALLPVFKGTMFRTVPGNLFEGLKLGAKVAWPTFVSGVPAVSTALGAVAHASPSATLFQITTFHGRRIRQYAVGGEDEIMVEPGSVFEVTAIFEMRPGLTLVSMAGQRPPDDHADLQAKFASLHDVTAMQMVSAAIEAIDQSNNEKARVLLLAALHLDSECVAALLLLRGLKSCMPAIFSLTSDPKEYELLSRAQKASETKQKEAQQAWDVLQHTSGAACWLAGMWHQHCLHEVSRAAKFYFQADQYNSLLGHFSLGKCQQHGDGIAANVREACKRYKESALRGHAQGMSAYGSLLLKGDGCEKDITDALRLFCMASDQGSSLGKANVGVCYKMGVGVPQDDPYAVKLFREAGEMGEAHAFHLLAICYAQGDAGLTKDPRQALKLYQRAAEQGHPGSQCNLGVFYSSGEEGVPQNFDEAFRLFRASAEQGNSGGQCNLGVCYERGRGCSVDLEEAVHYYKLAADQGYADGLFRLGNCYLHAIGVEKDTKKARELLQEASARGHAAAHKLLLSLP